jgi:TonB family protein
MSLSSVCTQQREKESKQLKSFLAFSLVGSGFLHVALLILGATLPWVRAYTSDAQPIQVVVVEPTQPQEKSVKREKAGSASAAGSSILGGRAGGSGGSSSVEGGRGRESRGTRSPLALPSLKLRFGQSLRAAPKERSQQPTQTVFPRQSPAGERQGQRSDTGNPSPVIPPKPEPEKPQELAQNPTPTPSSPPKSQANPVKSPVTTANVPSPPKNQQSQEEKPLEGIREQPSNLGTQSPNFVDKKVAGAHTNSSTNTEGERKATGNLGRDYSRGTSRADRDRMGGGLGNSTASSTGTGTGTGRGMGIGNGNGTGTGRGNSTGTGNGTGTGRGNGTGTGNGNGNQPGNDSAIATGSVNPKPNSQRSESRGSSSRGLVCRQCPKPDYPRNARRQDIEGEPKLSFDIDENGHTMNVRIATSSGNEELDQAAVAAVQRWRFDLSASNRRDVNATISFEMKGSQRQRQNRDRQQQAEESRKNRETVDAPPWGGRQEETPGSQLRQIEPEPSSRESTLAPEAAGFGSSNK